MTAVFQKKRKLVERGEFAIYLKLFLARGSVSTIVRICSLSRSDLFGIIRFAEKLVVLKLHFIGEQMNQKHAHHAEREK